MNLSVLYSYKSYSYYDKSKHYYDEEYEEQKPEGYSFRYRSYSKQYYDDKTEDGQSDGQSEVVDGATLPPGITETIE
jgi:hypothetical protein